jgi:hypothetical protein
MSMKRTKPTTKAPVRREFPWFRISMGVGIGGLALVLLGLFITSALDQGTRRAPLGTDRVPLYPNMVNIGQQQIDDGWQQVFYLVDEPDAQKVAAFYTQALANFYRNVPDEQTFCVRTPETGNSADWTPDSRTTVPFDYNCFFDNTYREITQSTQVTIQPGILQANGTDHRGKTLVVFEQRWTP